jgi:3-hydroxy acid dehydrogenase/malonic semialdehyde reductase
MIAVITGVSAGFGEAIARRLVADGSHVIGIARREERLRELSEELGPRFLGRVADVADPAAVRQALADLPTEFAAIDVLVNNAGLALGLDLAQKGKLEDWQRMVDTNIMGVLHCTHAVLPGMVERGRGHIVNLGSVAGSYPYPGGNVYGATKAFVRQFSLNLRADLLGTPVRVTDIEPGLCGGTEFSEVRFKGDVDKARSVYAGTDPLRAEDIAETVSWIVRLPARVNINTIEMMPVGQAFGAFAIDRKR